MRNLLLISLVFFFACGSDDTEDNPLPTYTIEGKWNVSRKQPKYDVYL